MHILVTGHSGFIRPRLIPYLMPAGHPVIGLESGVFAQCRFGQE
jgi:nucleoside-diphosphate-sugar epimerase